MGRSRGAVRRLALTVLGVAGLAAAAAEPAAAAELRYRLDAADGIPGAVRIAVTPDQPGRWRISAVWSGRAIANVRIETAKGKVLHRSTSASPVILDVLVGPGGAPVAQELRIRFAPTVARGALVGELLVEPPAPAAPPEPPPQELVGPGRCLEPAFGADAVGRGLQALAAVLERAGPAGVSWCGRWVDRVVEASRAAAQTTPTRGALDQVWAEMSHDPAPEEQIGVSLRQVMAAVEDLMRREALVKGKRDAEGDRLRRRREAAMEALSCLAPPGRAEPSEDSTT